MIAPDSVVDLEIESSRSLAAIPALRIQSLRVTRDEGRQSRRDSAARKPAAVTRRRRGPIEGAGATGVRYPLTLADGTRVPIETGRYREAILTRRVLRRSAAVRSAARSSAESSVVEHPSAFKSGLGYTAPPLSTYLESLSDLIRLRQKARNSRQPVFLAYTGATDSLAHVGGETLLRSFLKQLDETVEDIVRDSKTRSRLLSFQIMATTSGNTVEPD